jgi:hypothetical protein
VPHSQQASAYVMTIMDTLRLYDSHRAQVPHRYAPRKITVVNCEFQRISS